MERYSRARQSTDDDIIRRVCFACWITKAANTHLEYVMFIVPPKQKLLHERVMLSFPALFLVAGRYYVQRTAGGLL